MILDSLEGPLRLQNLAIDPPKRPDNAPFRPAELTEQQRLKLGLHLDSMLQNGDANAPMAMFHASVLGFRRADIDRERQVAVQALQRCKDNNDGRGLLDNACAAAYLGHKDVITAHDLDWILEQINVASSRTLLSSPDSLKIRLLRNVLGSVETYTSTDAHLCKYIAELPPVDGGVEQILDAGMLVRIQPFLPLNVHADLWEKGRGLLHRLTQERHWDGIFHLAGSMTIIAAEEVKMTEAGLQIKHHPKKAKPVEPITPFPATLGFIRHAKL